MTFSMLQLMLRRSLARTWDFTGWLPSFTEFYHYELFVFFNFEWRLVDSRSLGDDGGSLSNSIPVDDE